MFFPLSLSLSRAFTVPVKVALMSTTQPQRHAIDAADIPPRPFLRLKTGKDTIDDDNALEEAVNGEGKLDEGGKLGGGHAHHTHEGGIDVYDTAPEACHRRRRHPAAAFLRPNMAKDAVDDDIALEEAVNQKGELDEGGKLGGGQAHRTHEGGIDVYNAAPEATQRCRRHPAVAFSAAEHGQGRRR